MAHCMFHTIVRYHALIKIIKTHKKIKYKSSILRSSATNIENRLMCCKRTSSVLSAVSVGRERERERKEKRDRDRDREMVRMTRTNDDA